MDVEAKPAAPKSTPGRRSLRLAMPFIVVLAVLTLLVTGALLANRPHWRTVTLQDKAGHAIATFDCPDDWVVPPKGNYSVGGQPTAQLRLQRRPPTGVMRWWLQYVLHTPLNSVSRTALSISAYSIADMKQPMGRNMDIDSLERMYKTGPIASISGIVITSDRRRHALGPALHLSLDITPAFFSRRVSSATSQPEHTEGLAIYPPHDTGNGTACIMAACTAPIGEYPRLQPMFDRVVQSIHLVRK